MPNHQLPPDVIRLLRAGAGVFASVDAVRDGVSSDRIRRLCKAGLLIRLARGVYASAEIFAECDQWDRFDLRSRAFVRACGPRAYAAGWSAVTCWRLSAISRPPALPSVVVPHGEGAETNSAYGTVRAAELPPEHRAVVRGCRVTTIPRTVVDIARTAPRPEALVVADAALDHVYRSALTSALDVVGGWPGSRDAAWVVRHADPHAESPLETLGRLTFIEHSLPLPHSNVWVGETPRRYRLDHLLADRWLAFEGDGAVKYDNRPDAGRVVADQREREWYLRELGLEVVRYGWSLARHDRARLAERFRSVLERHPVQERSYPWWREGSAARRPDR